MDVIPPIIYNTPNPRLIKEYILLNSTPQTIPSKVFSTMKKGTTRSASAHARAQFRKYKLPMIVKIKIAKRIQGPDVLKELQSLSQDGEVTDDASILIIALEQKVLQTPIEEAIKT